MRSGPLTAASSPLVLTFFLADIPSVCVCVWVKLEREREMERESERDSPKAVLYLSFPFSLSHSLTFALAHSLYVAFGAALPPFLQPKKREREGGKFHCVLRTGPYSTGIGSGICQILVGSDTNRGRLVCAHFAIED